VINCPHKDLPYYAKGMCKNCYHSQGRSKKSSLCEHALERKLYAKGLCKACYLKQYLKAKKPADEIAETRSQNSSN